MTEGALSSLRILDLSLDIAGPTCVGMMAGLGAEVIKVEPPEGDPSRRAGPFFQDDPHPEKSGLFLYVNQGKKSITLNLETETGREILRRLAPQVDVVVESYAPGYLAGLGLGYPEMERLNPRVVMTSVTPFGQDGPYRDWKADELVIYALSGHLYQFGDPDREPLKPGGSVALYFAGLAAFAATMTALYARRLTGEGQHVDLSILEAVASMMEPPLAEWHGGIVTKRNGNGGRGAASGQYQCLDGFVQVSTTVGNEASFQRFPELMEIPELADTKFATVDGRTQHREEADSLIKPWLAARPKFEIYQKAQALRLPFGFACTTEDLVNSPQFQARDWFATVDHPSTGSLKYPGAPYKMSKTPWEPRRAPLLGEHNEEIYCDRLGFSKEDLARLRAYKTI